MKKKVLFVTYGGGHVNIVRYIYKQLIKESCDIKIIALTNSVTTLIKERIPYSTMDNYLENFEYKDLILKFGEKLSHDYYDSNSGLLREQIVAYLGINFYDLVDDIGNEDEAFELFATNGHRVFNPKKSMKKILEVEKPDVVVLTSSMRVEKATGFAANELNIPVVRILDTLGDDDIIPYECTVCVMNKLAKKNLLINNKINPDDILITGQPDYEENIKIHEEIKSQIKIKINAEQYRKVITYVPQPRQKDNYIIMNELINIAEKNKEYLFIVKLHPNEFIQEYSSFIEKKPSNVLITKDSELPYYLHLSDIVLTKFSMGGLYAILMDKPLIVLNVLNESFFPDYSKYKVAISVNDINLLESRISEILESNSNINQELNIARKEFNNIENSVKNIVNVIYKRIKEKDMEAEYV